jgi:integrase
LNEAVHRGHIVQNPAKVAKPPRVEEEDIRHAAATMLLVLKVPLPAVMDIMGWSDASIAKRYMHVPRELVTAIAAEVGALMRAKTD